MSSTRGEWTAEQYDAYVAESRAAQGLPPKVTDLAVLHRFAQMLTSPRRPSLSSSLHPPSAAPRPAAGRSRHGEGNASTPSVPVTAVSRLGRGSGTERAA